MKLTKQEKLILIEIFKSSNGLFIFTLYRQLNISPKDLFASIENLKSIGFLDVNEDRATITNKGIDFAVKIPLKTKNDANIGRLVKEEFQGKKIKINEFYIPLNFKK